MNEWNASSSTAYVTRDRGGRISIERVRTTPPTRRDLMLEQAIADDLTRNDGKMFGHDVLKFFTMLNTYPEQWECIAADDRCAILERTPSHPHQSRIRYRYEPSSEYGGNPLMDAPRFFVTEEVGP